MKPSPPKRYSDLLTEICTIYESTVLPTKQQHRQNQTLSYHQMGNRIVAYLDWVGQDSSYGKQLIPKLSKDLSRRYGKGLGTRTVRYMRRFALNYPVNKVNEALPWSHYCILLSIKDPTQRLILEEQAIREKMSRPQLQNLVSFTLQTESSPTAFPLTPRNGSPGIFKIVSEPLPPKANGEPVLLDAGFGICIESSAASLEQLPNGTHVQRETNGRYQTVQCGRGERYCYHGTILKIIDGDTVKVRIRVAPQISVTEKLRLRGVDAMELGTPLGQKAKRALERLLKNPKEIIVYTYGNDRYGRYVADLIADNTYINKTLVEQHFARYLSMK